MTLITGTAGDDYLTGGSGNDIISGLEGNDTILVGAGIDVMNGGDGNDIFLFDSSSEHGFINGGAGSDTIRAIADDVVIGLQGDHSTYGTNHDFLNVEVVDAGGHSGVVLAGSDWNTNNMYDLIDLSNVQFIGIERIELQAGHDTLIGSNQDDVISGGTGNDVLYGGDGNDVFEVGLDEDYDFIDGGAGSDTILATADNVVIGLQGDHSTYGTDHDLVNVEVIDAGGHSGVIIAGSFRDTNNIYDLIDLSNVQLIGIERIELQAGNDTLIGSNQDDVIDGGTGGDILYGGAGNDVFEVGLGDGHDYRDGGTGSDTVLATEDDVQIGIANSKSGFGSHEGLINVEVIDAGGHTGVFLAGLDDGNRNYYDYIDLSNVQLVGIERIELYNGEDTLIGSNQDDTAYGGLGDDNLSGGAGNDSLAGGDGDDTLDGGSGNDSLDGDAGDDLLTGGAGSDLIDGGANDDVLYGQSDNDTLLGGDGNDTLQGDAGNDSLKGDAGDDTLRGNDGDDTLVGNAGNDRMVGGAGADAYNGGNGWDSVVYGSTSIVLDLSNLANSTGDAAGDSFDLVEVFIGSTAADVMVADGNARYFKGEAGNDTLTGGASADALEGNDGNDSLRGNEGDDTLRGDDGNDTLIGNAGDDWMVGGAGADAFNGGAGRDTVVYGDSSIVLDLANLSNNMGDAAGDAVFDNIEVFVGSTADDLMVADNAGRYFKGQNGDDTLTGGSSVDALEGNEGNDSLSGNAGNDTLRGDGGADTLDGGADNDNLTGGEGNDVFAFGADSGADTIADFEDGLDIIDLSATGLEYTDLTINQSGANVLVDLGGGNTIELVGVDVADVNSADFLFA